MKSINIIPLKFLNFICSAIVFAASIFVTNAVFLRDELFTFLAELTSITYIASVFSITIFPPLGRTTLLFLRLNISFSIL